VTKTKTVAQKIDERLRKAYPNAKCTLDFANPLELLIATILAAQCTDERVNMVTPALFRAYPGAAAFAGADAAELEEAIRSTGFYHNKAKSVIQCCKMLVEKHGGQVPRNMEALTALSGVGRKTANVILGNAFGIPGIVVDTHVRRLSQRMGLTKNDDPDKIEMDLRGQVPEKDWTDFSHRIVFHGRTVCLAKKPNCPGCLVNDLCPSAAVFHPELATFIPDARKAKKAKRTADDEDSG